MIPDQPQRGEERKDDLRGESDAGEPLHIMTEDREARNDFWWIERELHLSSSR